MLSPAIALLRDVARRLLSNDAPSQIAAGFTLGMVIGLLPKGNLIAISLCVLLFSLRVNKGFALAAALVFTVLGPCIDGFSHKLGSALLRVDLLQLCYASVFTLPLGPWLGFHNTVVAGSLAVGLYVAYPVFWTTRILAAWWKGVKETSDASRNRVPGILRVDTTHDPLPRAAR
jgi:uncharacterized protein (TIGR03546 family)